ITDIRYVLTQRALTIFCETYHIPDEVHPQLPSHNQTIHEMPSGKIGVYTSKGVPKDHFLKSFEFNAEHFATLVALPAPFHKYPEPFLCLVGISRYYTHDEDPYPEFLGDNDEGMDLIAFIGTAYESEGCREAARVCYRGRVLGHQFGPLRGKEREQAAIQEVRNKAKMKGYYNARVRSTSFRPGDLFYRNNEASHAKDGGKLGPKWEGPYEVTEALGKGAYRLRD
nr:reverse transcriptase domain-containing protein [Tanacetum cinerariifolium]